MSDRIFNIVTNEDEVTWQALLMDLVKSEEMDPWDIDISELSKKYIERVKKLKETDLRVSGKVLLAAAILLRIKSTRLVTDEIAAFDSLLAGDEEDLLYDEDTEMLDNRPYVDKEFYKKLKLIPRTPQPRKRKVSIYDLMDALQQALVVQKRRQIRMPPPVMEIPEKKVDLGEVMKDVYSRILGLFNKKEKATFSKLLPDDTKMGKVYTYLPLLHLANNHKVALEQHEHFGEIYVHLKNTNVDSELKEEA